MDTNKDFDDRSKSFDILDLPEYDYLYKPEDMPFSSDLSFSISNEPKFSPAIPTGAGKHFLNRYAGPKESSRQTHIDVRAEKEKGLDYFGTSASHARHMKEPPFIPFGQSRDLHPEARIGYDFQPYAGSGAEQAVYVNANQYQCIKKRKERRDYLDSLEKKTNAAYQHESRHKHAMKRPRAPSGRFLTKEEAFFEETAKHT
ncbi:uncharacterized protein NEMAJ01_1278 [Nematocida major]|uniref:uncharacterized protein n=1 Tax=Nematocida major TaxID=1912982 RepID=UPI002008563F|nr:uncharacterized protein NEMAJ01_1278 [Nematocida major]KAH9386382.1 hypothetical protein NEMAJ01_1278 [Nematocida major]